MVPLIRLSGFWLKEFGFEIGKTYEVRGKANRLQLVIIDVPGKKGNYANMVKDSSIV